MELLKQFAAKASFRTVVAVFLALGRRPPRVLADRFAAGRFAVLARSLRPGLVVTWPQLHIAAGARVGWFVWIDSRYGVTIDDDARIGSLSVIKTTRRVVTEAGLIRVGRSVRLSSGASIRSRSLYNSLESEPTRA